MRERTTSRSARPRCGTSCAPKPGAAIALGLREPVTPGAAAGGRLDGEIERAAGLDAGASRATRSSSRRGTVHAIGADVALCEIQQNSDITYRLYDYGRPRELHLDQAVPVADLGVHPGRSRCR